MLFGIGTWFFQEYTTTEALKRIWDTGFRAAEIWMEHPLRTGESITDIRKLVQELFVKVTLHATSYDLNLTSINSGIQAESLKQARHAVKMAAEIGADLMVLHPGRLSTLYENKAATRQRLYSILRDLDSMAADENITIALEIMENKPKEIFVSLQDVMEFLEFDWERIRLTFDIAHTRTIMDPAAFLEMLPKNSIAHVHLSDGDDKYIHMPLGKGSIAIDDVLSSLSSFYTGLVIIEGYIPGRGDATARENFNYLERRGWIGKHP